MFFFFQAEDGIRDSPVTGVQTCALPISVKRDRFASINAGEQVGTVITRPLDFKNGALHLNAQIAKGGEINVAVLTRDAQPIAPWTIESCSALHGDSIDMPVSWQIGRASCRERV